MIPPIDEAVLEANPKFAVLHKTLTTILLNQDGSTKVPPTPAERESSENLQKYQVRAAKSHLLRSAVAEIPLSPEDVADKSALPAELLELIVLLSLHLSNTKLPPSSRQLLEDDSPLSLLPHYLPTIGALLSTHFQQQCLPLARILHPQSNISTASLQKTIPNLPTDILKLNAELSSNQQALLESRRKLLPLTTAILAVHRQAYSQLITTLESTTHGSLARSAKSRSEYHATEATLQSLLAKILEINVGNAVYPKEAREALEVYGGELRDGRIRMEEKSREARRELERYGVGRDNAGKDGDGLSYEGEGVGKEKVMKEIARVYRLMEKEMEEIRSDMERLKKS